MARQTPPASLWAPEESKRLMFALYLAEQGLIGEGE